MRDLQAEEERAKKEVENIVRKVGFPPSSPPPPSFAKQHGNSTPLCMMAVFILRSAANAGIPRHIEADFF